MKGHFIKNGVSFLLNTKDETQIQGSKLEAVLTIGNEQEHEIKIEGLFVSLNTANFKAVYGKKENAFEQIQIIKFENTSIKSHQEVKYDIEFILEENCLITDKKQSHFLKYGNEENSDHLQLTIIPHDIFIKISELIQNFHRFKLKEFRPHKVGKKTGVEFKYSPPASRDLACVDSFLLVQRLEQESLELECTFNIRKLNLALPHAPAELQVKTMQLKLPQKNLSLGKDRQGVPMLNQDFILKNLDEAISSIKMKGLA